MRLTSLWSFRSSLVLSVLAALMPFATFFREADSVVMALTQRGQQAVQRTADQLAMVRVIQQRLTDVERKARWLLAFAEPGLQRPDERAAYDKARALLREALNELLVNAENADEREMAILINQLFEKEQLVDGQLQAMVAGAPAATLDAAFAGLQSVGNQLVMQASMRLDQAIDGLGQASRDEREHLRRIAVAWAVVPVVVLVGLGLLQRRSVRNLTAHLNKQADGAAIEPSPHWIPAELRSLGKPFERLRARTLADQESSRRLHENLLGALQRPLATLDEVAGQLASETAGELTRAQEELVGQMGAAAAAMRKVIDEVGPYVDRATTAGSALTITTNVAMHSLIGSVIAARRPEAEARALRLNASLEAVTVVGDAERLRAMVDQLLSNAMKFSPEGGEIRIILREAGTRMKLELEDDGPGIDEDERLRVFEPFFVGKASERLGAPGSGLGLSVVRECVTYHHGEIDIADARHPKRGARFRVQLPLNANARADG